jgi:serine/threonine protein phosphatase PrpC
VTAADAGEIVRPRPAADATDDEVTPDDEPRDAAEPDAANLDDADPDDADPDDALEEPDDSAEPDDASDPADDLDEPVFAAVVRPEVQVRWPSGVVPELGRLSPADLAGPVAALDQLADALGTMFPEAGPGSLRSDGVRWSSTYGWQLLLTPPYDTSGAHQPTAAAFDETAFGAGWRRDQQAVAIALTEAAFGRRPTDPSEVRRLADLTAGDLPHGFDAAVNLLLREQVRPGDTGPLRTLAEALRRQPDTPLAARCYLESGVGSAKARGRGALDNEDVATGIVDADGGVRLGLFDGATGDGTGSGREAAVAACERIMHSWNAPGIAPTTLLAAADEAVSTTDGCTTAVVATVDSGGRARLASLGDSSAWLVRRGWRGAFHTWRLTPAHTVFAASIRVSADRAGGYSELTHYLGGGAAEMFATEFTLCAGDLLVLVSDGAATAQRNEWFGDVLSALAADRSAEDRPLGAALAAELVARAEHRGGFDNATALIAEFMPA